MINPVQFYKCLAEETRLRSLLLILRESELCVCELMVAIDDSQPKISRHLAQLRSCGLLTDRRQGQWVFYSINSELPDWARQVLDITLQESADFLQDTTKRLQAMGDRPERKVACG